MISPTQTARSADLGLALTFAAPGPRRCELLLALEAAGRRRRAAPAPRPLRLAWALDTLLSDGVRHAEPAPARAAARAFSAGDGFLPGQLIDRSI